MKAEGENKGDRGLSKERCIDWSDSSQASVGTSPAQPAPVGSKPAPCQDAPGGGVRILGHHLKYSPGDPHPCGAHQSPWLPQGNGLCQPELQPWVLHVLGGCS